MRAEHMGVVFAIAALLLAGTAKAAIDVEVPGDSRSFSPGDEYLDSVIHVTFDELLPKSSWISIYIDGETFPRGQISLDRYLREEGQYDFVNQTFAYIINASGTNTWKDYPEQGFSYRVSVTGLCGDPSCLVGDPPVDNCGGPGNCGICSGTPGEWWYGSYPCSWSIERTGFFEGSVNGDPDATGLKLIEDTGGSIQIPESAVPGSVEWNVEKGASSPAQVEVAMRAACKGMSYGNSPVTLTDGWVLNGITVLGGQSCSSISQNPGGKTSTLEGTSCRVSIGHSFDGSSLNEGYRKYGGPGNLPGGGIYKDSVYQSQGTQADWDGASGEIVIKDFDSRAYYYMVYLPANGPMVCAYTSYSVSQGMPWSASKQITGAQAGYMEPYERLFSGQELSGFPSLANPGCPQGVLPNRCTLGSASYSASADPQGPVEVSYAYGQGLSVTGTSDTKTLSEEESFSVNVSEFSVGISDITRDIGNHTIEISVMDGPSELWRGSFGMFVCDDLDRDGFCSGSGDCNDSNHLVHPGMNETCDGLDNDCDGEVDEGISGMGERLGQPCNDWPYSVCAGTWVCNPNGTDLVCRPDSGISPGDRSEVCKNRLDDDCDGTVDEQYELANGTQKEACIDDDIYCVEGKKRECGVCKDGVSTCAGGVWSACEGAGKPGVETCNREDDDCDGIVDNVFGKASRDDTQCGCYGNSGPVMETCNAIDDDCDGKIDDGVTDCCVPGNTRNCGTNVGSCEYGIQECDEGSWGECRGAVLPASEVCCDGLDNDCNGYADDGCSELACEQGGSQVSIYYWAMIGIGFLLLMGVLIYKEFM